jgi:hypothetical protein
LRAGIIRHKRTRYDAGAVCTVPERGVIAEYGPFIPTPPPTHERLPCDPNP